MHIHGRRPLGAVSLVSLGRSSPLTYLPLRDIVPTDERNVPPLNRIGDPDDILASLRVENGKVGLLLFPSPVFFCLAYGS